MKNNAPFIDCSEFILRLPRESDIEDRLKIGRSVEFVKMCGGSISDFRPFKESDMRGWYKRICESPCEWVIEKNGHCIGIARLTVLNDNTAVYSIGIFDDTLYGKGNGTKVTLAVLDYAFNTLLLDSVSLKVAEFNKRGIRCYEKCGFKQVGIGHDAFVADGVAYSDIIMKVQKSEYQELVQNNLTGS